MALMSTSWEIRLGDQKSGDARHTDSSQLKPLISDESQQPSV